ncbi:helix-turn-helix domain-containing protein [Phytoactinopolyspora endophytica]|uniref:helix-turn-helix domain-containing protein n=1 Tax=Phytoactinopolyspora endophytica TaxID=1642495 RepID=UPI0013ED6ED5|nr:AraC family transcriptional regulator [Phytoactinopolyspora endophytica]
MGESTIELVPRLGPTVADYPPGSTFGPRDARSFEFVWILHGRATWSCDETTNTLVPGQLLLVRPGMRDFFRWDPHRSTRHAYVHFTLPDGASPLPPRREWPLTRQLDEGGGPMGSLCQYLLWLGEAQPHGWRERACDVLSLLLRTFVAGPLPGQEGPPLPAPLEAMAAHVAGHWSDGVARPVPLNELATAASISTSSLCRIFRDRFGVGPVAALELVRLARAEPLLWMSNLTLESIAKQCGFTDAYHFSRRFRTVYGVPPSVFRSEAPSASRPSPLADAGLRPLERRLHGADS